jgi:hypothetical protein
MLTNLWHGGKLQVLLSKTHNNIRDHPREDLLIHPIKEDLQIPTHKEDL